MVKSTGMDCVELLPEFPETTMVVEYVPAESPAMFGVTVNAAGAVPEVMESESHPAVVSALQFNVPVPELETVMVCGERPFPSAEAEKATPLGLRLTSAPRLSP